MGKPTKAQKKEFWELCGIKFDWHPRVTRHAYQTPNGEWHFGSPTFNLNNLFQYAVPKARANGVTKIVFLYFEDAVWCQLFGGFQAQEEIACGKAETEEDALFWAISPILKGAKK